MKEITKILLGMQDKKYRDFVISLTPTVESDSVIGVRTPDIRRLSREIYRSGEYNAFLSSLPHKYYEENNLHADILSQMSDYDECIKVLNSFLPHIDNWATCDMLRPRCFKKEKPRLLLQIECWLSSHRTYTVRFGIEMLMVHFLDTDFNPKFLERVARIRSREYYVNMMIAWYFATALAKQYEAVLPFLEQKKLEVWVHNKTIQKAKESLRITDEQKAYLKTLRIK